MLYPVNKDPSTLKWRGSGMDTRRAWLCGHKHRSGIFRGRTPYMCANCVQPPGENSLPQPPKEKQDV
jgi:hypothetical protein